MSKQYLPSIVVQIKILIKKKSKMICERFLDPELSEFLSCQLSEYFELDVIKHAFDQSEFQNVLHYEFGADLTS